MNLFEGTEGLRVVGLKGEGIFTAAIAHLERIGRQAEEESDDKGDAEGWHWLAEIRVSSAKPESCSKLARV